MHHEHGPTEEKPFGNPFMQQKLKSMYPSHSPNSIIAAHFFVAVVFIPIGVAIVFLSDKIFEKEIRYDDVKNCKYNSSGDFSFPFNGSTVTQGCRTRVQFQIDKSVSAPIYIYYRIIGFYQNYRNYQQSRDQEQLMGTTTDGTENCWPFRRPGEFDNSGATPVTVFDSATQQLTTTAYGSMVYNPCGSIAWSMFNDSISIYKVPDSSVINLDTPTLPPSTSVVCIGGGFDAAGESTIASNGCTKKGIALDPDTDSRFKKPSSISVNEWSNAGHNTSDPFLSQGYYANEPGHKVPVATDEDFIVWARTAGLPDFRKLYRRIDTQLVAGDYLLEVEEFFDTTSFGAEKYVVLATTSEFGGRNFVLGIALIVMGCVAFVLAVAFIAITVTKRS